MEIDLLWLFYSSVCLLVVTLVVIYLLERPRIVDIKSKHVFITGCDTGFGHDLVVRCLANGMTVFAGCLTQKGISGLTHETRWLPGKLFTILVDVTDDESVEQARQFVVENLKNKRLWAIVNNAGITGQGGPDDWQTVADYRTALDVNTLGVIRVTHAFKDLLKAAHGRVVTMSSVSGKVPFPLFGPYCVSKHAVGAYCDVLRHEMRPFGVSVHILEPGFFRTKIVTPEYLTENFQPAIDRLSEDRKLEYGQDYMDKLVETSKKPNRYASSRTSQAVDAYFHALTALLPRNRYWVGVDAIFFFAPVSVLPTWAQDLLYRLLWHVGNVPKPRQSATQTTTKEEQQNGIH